MNQPTGSRLAKTGVTEYTVGVLVQANFGRREDLVIAGVPVGREITELDMVEAPQQDGSIIVIVGTDAPLTSSQLNLVAKRAALGINALVAGEDMEGVNGNKAFGIPHGRLRDVMKKYNRTAGAP